MRGYISIGSNIDKEQHIPASLHALEAVFGELVISSIYESAPVGFCGDLFHNLVVSFECDLDVKSVAKLLRQIELDNGRTRDSQKFSSRTLDLDLILYGEMIIHEGRLQIPRDEIERYAFVLEPLAEIAAMQTHPVSGKTFHQLWREFDKTHLMQKRIALTK